MVLEIKKTCPLQGSLSFFLRESKYIKKYILCLNSLVQL